MNNIRILGLSKSQSDLLIKLVALSKQVSYGPFSFKPENRQEEIAFSFLWSLGYLTQISNKIGGFRIVLWELGDKSKLIFNIRRHGKRRKRVA
jgi:hypothetical protein